MEILEKINAELEAFKTKRAELTKQLQTEFPKLFTPLFEKSKLIESFGWRQYTPYFNDGDECVFGVHNDDLTINGEDEYDIDVLREENWEDKKGRVKNPNYNPEEGAILDDIKKVLSGIPEEFYKDLFGDHMEVTVNKDGTIETEEYDHD